MTSAFGNVEVWKFLIYSLVVWIYFSFYNGNFSNFFSNDSILETDKHQLFCSPSTCSFHKNSAEYLFWIFNVVVCSNFIVWASFIQSNLMSFLGNIVKLSIFQNFWINLCRLSVLMWFDVKLVCPFSALPSSKTHPNFVSIPFGLSFSPTITS